MPPVAVISLALLFAMMSLLDTSDAIFMVKAYAWAFSSPSRKIYYNRITTSLSVVVALLIGTIELVHFAAAELALRGWFIGAWPSLNFETLGYLIAGLFGCW